MPADLPPEPPVQPPSADPPAPAPFQPAQFQPTPPPPGPDRSQRQDDPFRSVWSMSPVADARAGGKAGRRRSDLRLGAGLVGGLVTFVPFGLIASILWGWWDGDWTWGSGGWVVVLVGAAAAFAVGGVVASQD